MALNPGQNSTGGPGGGAALDVLPQPTPSKDVLVTIKAIDPVGPIVTCAHADGLSTKTFTPSTGWVFTARPRRQSMTEFTGIDPITMIVPVQFGDGVNTKWNVNPMISALQGLMLNLVGPRNEPAVVSIACPLLEFTSLKWVINDLSYASEYLRGDGFRYYAQMNITLLQYIPTALTVTNSAKSVAQRAAATAKAASSSGTAGPSNKTYTVKSGDTLNSIAAKELGNANQWSSIATLNGIRDPKTLSVGQVLRLPAAK